MPKKNQSELWEIEVRPTDELIEYARNPRKNDHAVDKIASIIKEFGFRVPIIAKSDGSVVDGHLRLKAAKKLGLKEVPVMSADDLTEEQIKALRISINKMADLADWDEDLLRLEISELDDLNFDLDLLGFDQSEIDALRFDDDAEIEMPELNDGDREPFQQMTFTLHDDQAEELNRALTAAKNMGPMDTSLNENGNGNALARIAEMFNGNFGGPGGGE